MLLLDKLYIMQKLLLPNRYKKIGWLIFIPTTIFGIIIRPLTSEKTTLSAWVFSLFSGDPLSKSKSFSFIYTDVTDTVVGILFIVGGLLIGFSKEKNEDEFIASLRQSSLLWAVLVNYILLLFCFVFIYGMAFFDVMVYNMFTVLIIFIGRFNYVLYRNFKSMAREKYN
jgi:hypothetical protein